MEKHFDELADLWFDGLNSQVDFDIEFSDIRKKYNKWVEAK